MEARPLAEWLGSCPAHRSRKHAGLRPRTDSLGPVATLVDGRPAVSDNFCQVCSSTSRRRRGSTAPAPPKHALQTDAVRVRARHPVGHQFEMRLKTLHDLLSCGAKGRFRPGVRDQIVDGKELSCWSQPTQHRLNIQRAVGWRDGTVEGVFEDPLDLPQWRVAQKVCTVASARSPASVRRCRARATAEGAKSRPTTSKPARAKATTSCPVPQPGTNTVPRGSSGCAARKSTKPGAGSPLSHRVSPQR